MLRLLGILLTSLSLFAGSMALAQSRKETLADIRQELSFLFVEIQRLNQELSTTGATGTVAGDTLLQRLDALEGEFKRITGKVEQLEFRIEQIVKDGTNRIGDLEFRLVELEGGDVSTLGETSTLGGEQQLPTILPVEIPSDATTGELAVSEQADFEAAKVAYDAGEYRQAAGLFEAFTENYPGGPLTAEAGFWRGESLAALSEWSSAARSFLESFSATPDGALAPRALFRLGVSLDKIGQREEACLTLNEVDLRYPGSDAGVEALTVMAELGCAS